MEMSLEKISGLPIWFDKKNNKLEFRGNFSGMKKSERSLEELRPYLENSKADGLDPIYRVWRQIHLRQDNEKIKAANLRYDLTLILPGKIGNEFSKTAGHYHLPYPEIFEVLCGRAHFLVQKPDKDSKNISKVYLAEAGPGEKFIVPPGFGHNTINIFDKPLLMANWVSKRAIYDYEPYKNNHGACYYLTADGDLVDIIKNPDYESAPDIIKIHPKEYSELELTKNRPLYSLVNNIDKLRFLNYPEEFPGEWRNW